MLTQESQELLNSIFEQIDRMKTEDIKQFMNIAISKILQGVALLHILY